MSDVENSDDERYANESFENESDNEIPEITEFESETTENSEDDVLTSVKINTGPIKRGTHRLSASRNTDTIPFASSSDEEDDVIVGQTLAEINTPSMHFEENLNATTSIRSSRSILPENHHRLKSVEELQESASEFIDEKEEQEFQKIKEMEERYMQENSDKIPHNNENNLKKISTVDDEEKYLTTDDEYDEQEAETETETDNEPVWEHEPTTEDENASEDDEFESKRENHNVQSSTSQESFVENNIQQPNNLNSPQNQRTLETHSSSENLPLDQANLMQMIQNSLENLKTSSNSNDNELAVLQANDPAAIFNPQNIAMALVKAIKSSSFTNQQQSLTNPVTELQVVNEESNILDTVESDQQNNDLEQENSSVENGDYDDEEEDTEKDDDNIEEIQNGNGQICELDYDDDEDIYYNSQLDYRITSKTPSSFNSDEYLFHANFIKPFFRSKLTDKLRVKPQPRKSMSFSNERMREIERHNQILLRKIITQKPTYTAKNQRPHQPFIQKLPSSQTNIRTTTSAVNRKKQQRQIDMDNQVLKRKIEAISLRRRPLIS